MEEISEEYISEEYISEEYISEENISDKYISEEYISEEYISVEEFHSLFIVLKITVCPYHIFDLLQRLRIYFRGGYFHQGYFYGVYFHRGLSYVAHSTRVLKIRKKLQGVLL